jgi:hypothetical protein
MHVHARPAHHDQPLTPIESFVPTWLSSKQINHVIHPPVGCSQVSYKIERNRDCTPSHYTLDSNDLCLLPPRRILGVRMATVFSSSALCLPAPEPGVPVHVPSLAVAAVGICNGGGRGLRLRGLGATSFPTSPLFSGLKNAGVGPCCRPSCANRPGVAAPAAGAAALLVARVTWRLWPALKPGVARGRAAHLDRMGMICATQSACCDFVPAAAVLGCGGTAQG